MALIKLVPKLVVALVLSALGLVSSSTSVSAQTANEQLEVILVIDTSESMQPAIEAAKAAANEFVEAMPTDVRIGVETFADAARVLTPPTLDRDVIAREIGTIVAEGDTALYDVVVAASQHFTPSTEHKVIVLLSDGKDEGSRATLEQAVIALEGVQVEAISLTTPLTDLASLTALGPVTSADDAAGVSAAFARIAGLIVEVIESIPPPTTTPPTTTPPTTATTKTTTTTTTTTPPPTTVVAVVPPPILRQPPPLASASTMPLWFGGIGLFLGLFLLAVLLFPRAGVSRTQLGIDTPRRASDFGSRTTTAIDDALVRYGKRADLENALAVADIGMKPAEFVSSVVMVAVVAGLVGLFFGGPLVGLLIASTVCLGVRFYVRRSKAQRQAAFADQLPDVLQLVTTALRSGYGITQALESVAEEAEEPARSEFAHVLVEARMGRDLSDTLGALARRMESQDLGWVVSAIDINRETGGNLSEILHQVGATIRERARMHRQVRTLTAEGRLSARILTGLPVVMLLWQWRVNPENLELLTHGIGLVFLVFAGVLIIVGAAWVRKVVNSVAL